MAEAAEATTTEAAEATTTDDTTTDVETDETAQQTDGTDWKAEARKHERRAKENAAKARENAKAAEELAKLKAESMSETEKAVAAAIEQGRAEGRREGSSSLVAAKLEASLAGRGVDAAALIEGIDPAKFLDDEGQPDVDAITEWVDRVAPKPDENDDEISRKAFPDIGQGRRTAPDGKDALNGDPLLNALKSKVGAR